MDILAERRRGILDGIWSEPEEGGWVDIEGEKGISYEKEAGEGRTKLGNGSMTLSEGVTKWNGNICSWKITSRDKKNCLDWMLSRR